MFQIHSQCIKFQSLNLISRRKFMKKTLLLSLSRFIAFKR
ncbi:hypothetical protein HMPREF1423_00588 [Helicobacter pylori GAM270ASi]|nr:hypothetical protein HMPREF1423_00588 [Helicobacter pylori GAM270ASi]